MRPQSEIELDLDRRPRSGAHETNRIPTAANRLVAIKRPRDRFEDGRLAGAVWTDDAGETGLEMNFRLSVLTEVGEPETIQPHATDSSPAGPATRSASRR